MQVASNEGGSGGGAQSDVKKDNPPEELKATLMPQLVELKSFSLLLLPDNSDYEFWRGYGIVDLQFFRDEKQDRALVQFTFTDPPEADGELVSSHYYIVENKSAPPHVRMVSSHGGVQHGCLWLDSVAHLKQMRFHVQRYLYESANPKDVYLGPTWCAEYTYE